MKKTTYAIIALLLLIIIGETIFFSIIFTHGVKREYYYPGVYETTTYEPKVVIDKGDKDYHIFVDDTIITNIESDSIYAVKTDTIVLTGKNLKVYVDH